MIRHAPALIRCGALCLACARATFAQDFAGAAPPGSDRDPGALLERALPSTAIRAAASVTQVRWWGLPELETRAALVSGAWRSARAALGLSQTGEPELGWTALALGVGAASPHAGAGLRACARRDRDAPWSVARAVPTGAGVEAGVAVWLVPAAGLRVWASAPQAFTSGAAPPLTRPLELGVRAGGASAAWLRLVAPRAGDDGERALGVSIAAAPLLTWAEVRDAPLRGAVGLEAGLSELQVGVRVDSHPVLGETVRVQLAWVRAARSRP